ncbi:MAG: glycoside hydrolase family 99-like domain-containing protein, partial [Synergistaceae bacterium]|nr:glycoside hydrolase family 99-like domain-containing protein [Synergistaceae bacterium]
AKLKFSINYEDNTVGKMVEAKAVMPVNAVSTAHEAIKFLNDQYFQKASYVKTANGRPLFLCYGPEYFSTAEQWNAIFSELSTRPYFVDLAYDAGVTNEVSPYASSETVNPDAVFEWLAVPASGELKRGQLVDQLNWFYNRYKDASYLIGSAFPSYDDETLKEAHLEDAASSLGFKDGETFKLMLDAARQARVDIVQLATWNDYGEGTMIEPTVERGYKELEEVQDFRKNWGTASFTSEDLKLPIELFKIMKDPASSNALKALAAQAYDELFNDNVVNFRLYAQQAIEEAAKQPQAPDNPDDNPDDTNDPDNPDGPGGDNARGGSGGGCDTAEFGGIVQAALLVVFAARKRRFRK